MKRVSIGSWTFSLGPHADNPVPWSELMRKLSELGYDGVEVGGFSIHPRPENQPSREDRQRVKQEAADLGLGFSGYVPDLWGEKLIDTEGPSGYVREFRRGIGFAADLGIAGICIDTLLSPRALEEMDYASARDRLVSVWKRCSKEAADKGCYVTWEFEPVYAFNKPSEVLRIVDEVNEDNFGIAFDTCHAEMIAGYGAGQTGLKEILPGGCLELARKLRGKINHVHLMDCDGIVHTDGTGSQRPFGDGCLDFDAIIQELNRSPMPDDWWTIDPGFLPDAWAVAERCKQYVDARNEKYG